MRTHRTLIISLFGLVLSACSANESNAAEECEIPEICETCEVCTENKACPQSPFPEGLVLPQIYVQGKLFLSTADLDALKTNIIDPILTYYENENQTVVSIMVTPEEFGTSIINTIIVDVLISDNDSNQIPLHMSVLIDRVSGVFPTWQQESIGP